MSDKRKKTVDPPYEEKAVTGTPIKYTAAIFCFGIALLTLYMAFAVPKEGTAMQSVRNLIRGLSGDVPFALSLIFIWIGVLIIGSARGKRVKVFNVIMYSFMFLSIFAGVHVFSSKQIIDSLNVNSYPQFIVTSYSKQIGGGLLGSFLAYFLYGYIGEVAGCAVCVLFVTLSLVATGSAAKMFSWGMDKAEKERNRRDEREERRRKENEELFKEFAEDESRRRKAVKSQRDSETPQQRARRRQQSRPHERISDPDRETMYIPNRGETDSDRRRAATQAFYDPAADDELPKTRRRASGQKIEVPKSIHELKGEDRESVRGKGKKTRFSDPNSVRRPAKASTQDENVAETETPGDSSVSVEAMAAVAEQSRRAKKENTAAVQPEKIDPVISESEEATEEDIDDIFTVKEEKSEDAAFEPLDYMKDTRRGGRTAPGKAEDENCVSESKRKDSMFRETDAPEYNFPPIDLLERGSKDDEIRKHEASDNNKAEVLIDTLNSFGIGTRLSGIAHGPAVTRFELQPEAGIKLSRITSLADDIALALAAESVRIEAPIPGKSAVGVEIPNDKIETVRLRDVLESSEALRNTSKIAVGLGKDNSGRYVVADIAKMPHVLIAGQTGSGKSVCINSIITSILYRSSPEDVRMILIDPKVVELQVYNDIPHLIAPVVTDPKKAASALQWAVTEMLDRYKKFSSKGVRNIKGYNAALKKDEEKMPQIIIVIDELADLMMAAPGEVEDSICRIAQLARAAGMHLVIATQRPSVNVITGIIKANIPTRIAFAVASITDSRVMIDHGGAEKLLGNGDMLFVPNGGKTLRVQGTWVSDEEVEKVVGYIKDCCGSNYDEDVQEKIENSVKSDAEIEDTNSELDDRLAEAVEIVVEAGQASVSMLQRRMRVGYARAGRLIDEMQKRGIVSEADGAKPRNVLMTREQFRQTFGEDI